MAPTARDRLRTVACAVTLTAAVVVSVGSPAPAGSSDPNDGGSSDRTFGTRPMPLDLAAVTRVARAFGIAAEPERIVGGWDAEDDVRSLYLWRAPSAWYVQFTDGSTLLGPAGDRDQICAQPEPPFGCAVPGVEFVADVAAPPPAAEEATRTARRLLESTGLLRGDWDILVLEPSRDAVPCPEELETPFPCTRQTVPSRTVIFTRDLGRDAAAARWTVIVGPRAIVLSAVGRVAEPR